MTEEQEQIVSWEQGVETSEYVQLETGKIKKLIINNWRLVKCLKYDETKVEFRANVLNEDGVKVNKTLKTTSNRLKLALRKVLENKNSEQDVVALTIVKAGDGFDTSYVVEETKL